MNEKDNFLNTQTILAIALIGVVWFFWQKHIAEKYPPQKTASTTSTAKNLLKAEPPLIAPTTKRSRKNKNYRWLQFENEYASFKISSRGMGLYDLVLKQFTDRKGKYISFSQKDQGLSLTTLPDQKDLLFKIKKENKNLFVGRAYYKGTTIIKKIQIIPDQYLINISIDINKKGNALNKIFIKNIEPLHANNGIGFFGDRFDVQSLYVRSFSEEDRTYIESQENFSLKKDGVQITSLNSHYFSSIFINQSNIIPDFLVSTSVKDKTIDSYWSYNLTQSEPKLNLKYRVFFGPQSLELFNRIDNRLQSVIDFGWFSSIAILILNFLKWIYSIINNWGFSIIALTILVRILLLPFNIMSFRSMKSMQKIQPQLKTLREKHKKDKVRLNQEMMSLMKTHKVNPLGGCLPMLLQFPIFIALFQVLGQSIELYKSPFILWITDLSLKDPYYVFPVLAGLVIFVQQKMTPSNLDATQQKIMLIMPLIFSVFMLSLPSGLSLYILINSFFGVIQQYFFIRTPKTA